MISHATIGSDLLILHPDHMTAEQLFSSLAHIISLSRADGKCSATQLATKRTTAQNGVTVRDTDNLQMSVIQKTNTQVVIYKKMSIHRLNKKIYKHTVYFKLVSSLLPA